MALFFNCATLRQYILSRVEQFKDSSQVSPIFFSSERGPSFHYLIEDFLKCGAPSSSPPSNGVRERGRTAWREEEDRISARGEGT